MAGEGSGSGRRSSSFALTCSLMRQYMAQHQHQQQRQAQVANLARLFQAPPPTLLPVAPAEANERRTIQLFPVRDGATMAHAAQQMPEVTMVTPMTIFYGGQVIRVDNVPADKGMALIKMAQSMNTPPQSGKVVVVDVPDEEPEVVVEPSAAISAIQARRLSLQRFLRKRKERNDPNYNDDEFPPKKIGGGGDEPWEDDVPDSLWLSL